MEPPGAAPPPTGLPSTWLQPRSPAKSSVAPGLPLGTVLPPLGLCVPENGSWGQAWPLRGHCQPPVALQPHLGVHMLVGPGTQQLRGLPFIDCGSSVVAAMSLQATAGPSPHCSITHSIKFYEVLMGPLSRTLEDRRPAQRGLRFPPATAICS